MDLDIIDKLVRRHFPLTPRGIIDHLKLLRPIYKATAAYGHFGRNEPGFTWERTSGSNPKTDAACVRPTTTPGERSGTDLNLSPSFLYYLLRRTRDYDGITGLAKRGPFERMLNQHSCCGLSELDKELPLRESDRIMLLHRETRLADVPGPGAAACALNPLRHAGLRRASLANDAIPTFAVKGEDNDTYYKHIHSALGHQPSITMDDGADLVSVLHSGRTNHRILGGTEETTTGVIRLRSMAKKGVLKFPVISVNDADTKHMFDNRYGTGQSTMDGVIRATNRLITGSTGYRGLWLVRSGHCEPRQGTRRRCRDHGNRPLESA